MTIPPSLLVILSASAQSGAQFTFQALSPTKKETNHTFDPPFLLRQGEPGTSQYIILLYIETGVTPGSTRTLSLVQSDLF